MGEDSGIGKCTTTYNTVIDYVIGTWNVVQYVKSFKILDFVPLYSDVHCGLHIGLEFLCGEGKVYESGNETN